MAKISENSKVKIVEYGGQTTGSLNREETRIMERSMKELSRMVANRAEKRKLDQGFKFGCTVEISNKLYHFDFVFFGGNLIGENEEDI